MPESDVRKDDCSELAIKPRVIEPMRAVRWRGSLDPLAVPTRREPTIDAIAHFRTFDN